jgi:uncharacterized protein
MSETPPTTAYLQHMEAGTLPFQTCTACDTTFFYPRLMCPGCGSGDVEYRASAGRGAVYARTVIHQRDGEPYNVVLVDLDEGFRIMTSVEDVANDDLTIGMRVALKAIHPGEDGALPRPVFAAEEGA